MRWAYRTLPLISSLLVAFASFALSYVALRDVAADIEAVPAHLAWLVPIVIDGGVICASAVIWANAHEGRRRELFPFFVVAALVVMSVLVNAAHAGPTVLAKVIASLPPLVLLATLELVANVTRRAEHDTRTQATGLGEQDPVAARPAGPAVSGQPPAPDVPQSAPAAASKAAAKRATPKRPPAKKAPAKKAPAKKAPAKKAPAKAAAAQTSAVRDEAAPPAPVATTRRRPTRVAADPPTGELAA